jgi:dihydrofolate reductase
MPALPRIEGYAIVSEDGMLADATGVMPDTLKFDADKRFFEKGLDGVDVVFHGRHSHEGQPHSHLRRRVVLTRRIAAIEPDPAHRLVLHWNPAGATLEQVLATLEPPVNAIGIVGGGEVFGLFLDVYDAFYLTRVPRLRLPGGRPVFPEVPAQTPEQLMAAHGLALRQRRVLDPANALSLEDWLRPSRTS